MPITASAGYHTILCGNKRYKRIHLTRKSAIGCFCGECMGFKTSPVECTSRYCALYPFRHKTLKNHTGDLDRSELAR